MRKEKREVEPPFTSAAFDVVAVAASAGGLNALTQVLAALPADFPAAIVIVQHLHPRHRSLMAEIISRHTPLRVKQAEQGDRLAPGTVYMAPPDRQPAGEPRRPPLLQLRRSWSALCAPRPSGPAMSISSFP